MKARLLTLWARLSESFWLVPAAMALLAACLSFATVAVDQRVDTNLSGTMWIWSGGAEGARSLLSIVAGSMMTVAGTVFSITIAALALASQQFGPRLLRTFTSDRSNQLVLGTFISTFLYCLLVSRTVRGSNEGDFVPNISVSVAVLLACASIGVLIFFIHHVSSAIQAESVLAAVGHELRRDLAGMIPAAPPGPHEAESPIPRPDAPPGEVAAGQSGYIQAIDRDSLVRLAQQHDLLLELRFRPGDFISRHQPAFLVWPKEAATDETLADALRQTIGCGPKRTPLQDVRYGIRQLTEIAARALSPGINDPFTAMAALDWLIDALDDLAAAPPPSGVRLDDDDTPRLLERVIGFAELLHLGIDPIRAYGASSAMVAIHVLEGLRHLASRVCRHDTSDAVMLEARHTWEAAESALSPGFERDQVERAYEAVRQQIDHHRHRLPQRTDILPARDVYGGMRAQP